MKISIIGAGAMGGATVEGLLKGNYVQAADICVSDASQKAVERFADSGAIITTDNNAAAKWGDMVLVFVKPWLVEQVLTGIKDVLDYDRQTLVVVAAGVKSESIKEWMSKDGKMIPLFLVIPNIAIAQLQSMTFIVPSVASESQHTEQVVALFDSMGQTIITDEQHLAAGTTLASCGKGRRCQADCDADHAWCRGTAAGHRTAPRGSHRPGDDAWRCDHQGTERDGAQWIYIKCY